MLQTGRALTMFTIPSSEPSETPEWHGRNFNALIDSIETGSINTIEVPYRLIIKNSSSIGRGAQKMARDFVDLIHEIAARGCPVEIVVENDAQSKDPSSEYDDWDKGF